jgi:hypothetical protein
LVGFAIALIVAIPTNQTLNNANQASQNIKKAESVAVKTPQVKVAATETPEPKAQAEAQPAQQPVQPPQPTYVTGSHEDLMTQAGIASSDFPAVEYIISHESSWRLYASEPTTGAYGLCQSLPAYKMAAAGDDWQTNPVTQLKWCTQYATTRYGSWWGAYSTWVAQRWW